MREAQLVIMDEPTAALGVSQTAQVLALIRTLADRGIGVLLISHNLNDVFSVGGPDRGALSRRLVHSGDVAGYTRSASSRSSRRHSCNGGDVSIEAPGPPRPLAPLQPSWRHWVFDETLSTYLRQTLQKIRGGQTGVLPLLVGLGIVVIVFQLKASLFLSNQNLANLLTKPPSSSSSARRGLGAAPRRDRPLGRLQRRCRWRADGTHELRPYNLPWFVAILIGLAASAIIGMLIGAFVILLRLPSFIVSLAFYLASMGPPQDRCSRQLQRVDHALELEVDWPRAIEPPDDGGAHRRHSGGRRHLDPDRAPGPPTSGERLGGCALRDHRREGAGTRRCWRALAVCVQRQPRHLRNRRGDHLRGADLHGILVLWSFLLARTRFGRNIYAIGGNAEAARRAV